MQKNEIFLEKFDNINPRRILTWTLIFIGGVIMLTPIIFMTVTYTQLTLPTTPYV